MQEDIFQTPVAMIVFNRPRTTRVVFDAIAKIRPAKLLVIADGPRANRSGEEEQCAQVREIVRAVDWQCELLTNFADSNLGCQERVISGLDWVFSLVEEAIILEDDCVPDSSFFLFCQELLEKYRGDNRISYIAGANLVQDYVKIGDSYFFSQIGGIWGWATWRSEWQRYDRHLNDWPELKANKKLEEIFDQPRAVAYWTRIFDLMHENRGPNTWDYQWLYTGLKNNSLTIVPRVNLVHNIGFGEHATHTTEEDARFVLPSNPMRFPLKHPSSFIPSRSLDRQRVQDMISTPLFQRISTRLRRVTGRLFLKNSPTPNDRSHF